MKKVTTQAKSASKAAHGAATKVNGKPKTLKGASKAPAKKKKSADAPEPESVSRAPQRALVMEYTALSSNSREKGAFARVLVPGVKTKMVATGEMTPNEKDPEKMDKVFRSVAEHGLVPVDIRVTSGDNLNGQGVIVRENESASTNLTKVGIPVRFAGGTKHSFAVALGFRMNRKDEERANRTMAA